MFTVHRHWAAAVSRGWVKETPQGACRGEGVRGSHIQKSWEAVKRLDRLAPNLVNVCGFIWEWT